MLSIKSPLQRTCQGRRQHTARLLRLFIIGRASIFGGNIGYGWGVDSDPETTVVDGGLGGLSQFVAGGGIQTPNLRPKGVIGGGQIGYNWQAAPNWVFGIEADFQASAMKDSATVTVDLPDLAQSNQSNSMRIDWFGTVRGKLGYAANNWLFYATGGLAYGRIEASGSNVFPTTLPLIGFAGSTEETKAGWAAGAGIDWGIAPNWIVGVQYLYIDLGRVSFTETAINPAASPGLPGTSFTVSNRAAANIARVSVNYKF